MDPRWTTACWWASPRSRACTSCCGPSRASRCRTSTRPSWSGPSPPPPGPGTTTWPSRYRAAAGSRAAGCCWPWSATRSRRPTRPTCPRRRRAATWPRSCSCAKRAKTSRSSCGSRRTTSAACRWGGRGAGAGGEGGGGGRVWRLTIYRTGGPITLTDVLPRLQHMGVDVVDEHPYVFPAADPFWIYDFGLRRSVADSSRPGTDMRIDLVRDNIEGALGALWRGTIEDDGFNALVLDAHLNWSQAAMLRAYAKYLRQAGTTFSQDYIEQVLRSNP